MVYCKYNDKNYSVILPSDVPIKKYIEANNIYKSILIVNGCEELIVPFNKCKIFLYTEHELDENYCISKDSVYKILSPDKKLIVNYLNLMENIVVENVNTHNITVINIKFIDTLIIGKGE